MTENNVIRIKLDIGTVTKFVHSIKHLAAEMDLGHDRYVIDAKSVMGIYSLDLSKPLKLYIRSGKQSEIREAVKDFIV